MTAYKMVQSGKFQHKNILLLDENSKKTNDRTWCFWTKETSIWGPLFQKNGTPLCLPMKILNATYTYNPTHTTVFRTDFTIMF
jgi:hypothetical protein